MFSFWAPRQYSVCFKAFLCEDRSSNAFGMKIIGYQVKGDGDVELNSDVDSMQGSYVQVGECKPRKLKSGRITVQVKSGFIKANEMAGESGGDLSETVDFEGGDVDVDFSCVSINCCKLPKLFGKVVISASTGTSPIQFSFNLMKTESSRTSSEDQSLKGLKDIVDMDKCVCYRVSRNFLPQDDDHNSSGLGSHVDDVTWEHCLPKCSCNCGTPGGKTETSPLQKRSSVQSSSFTQRNGSLISNVIQCGKKRKYPLISSDTSGILSDSKLDDIADSILTCWKSLGRLLRFTEVELKEIELDYSGEKEKAFQMLYMWRERDPKNCVEEKLFNLFNEPKLKHAHLMSSVFI